METFDFKIAIARSLFNNFCAIAFSAQPHLISHEFVKSASLWLLGIKEKHSLLELVQICRQIPSAIVLVLDRQFRETIAKGLRVAQRLCRIRWSETMIVESLMYLLSSSHRLKRLLTSSLITPACKSKSWLPSSDRSLRLSFEISSTRGDLLLLFNSALLVEIGKVS